MVGKPFTAVQILAKLGQLERRIAKGETAALACKHAGVSPTAFKRWKKEYGGLARKLKNAAPSTRPAKAAEEQRIELAMRTLNEGIYDWDIAGDSIYYSDGVFRAVGTTSGTIRTALDWRNRIHPDDLPKYDAALRAHLKGETARFECDYRFRADDGTLHWARQHGVATRDARGRAIRLTGSTGDISELKAVEAVLAQSQERYALATQAATEGIYDWDLETGSLYLSDRAKEFFAVDGDALTPAAWNMLVHREDFQGYRDAIGRYFRKAAPQFEHEYRMRNAAGDYAWVLDRAVAVRDKADRAIRLVGALTDITERKNAEIDLRRARDEAIEALERQTATAEILRVIASSPSDLRPVFDAILQNATRLCDSHLGVLNLYDGEKVRTAAQCGGKPEFVKWLFGKGAFAPTPGSSFAQMFSDGQPYSVADLREAESYRDGRPITSNFTDLGGARSLLLVPLLKEGAVIGNISIYRPEVRPFTDKQTDLVRTFADQAVIAIENVRLFNETKEALERQTATAQILKVIASSPFDVKPVFDVIVASAQRLLRGTTVHATRVEGGSLHLVAYSMTDAAGVDALKGVYPLAIAGSPDEPIFSSGVARIIADIETEHGIPERILAAMRARGVRSNIMMPMRSGGMPIGTIIVNRAQPGKFTQHEIDLLQTFADQAVIAIENVRLFHETKEALERQTATAEILRVIASSPSDVQPVFDAIANIAYRLIGGFSTAVARVFDDVLHLVAFSSTDESGNEALKHAFPMPVSRSKAARTAAPVCIGDTEALPDSASALRELARVRDFRGILIVPLLRDGVATGTISVTRKEPGEFTSHQVDLLKTFADQAVIAIENVRLFNETKEALERQTATAEILQVISSSPTDTQPVFDAILERAAKLCDAENGILFRYEDGTYCALATRIPNPEHAAIFKKPRRPAPTSNTGIARLMREKRAVHIPDLLKDGSSAAVDPMRLQTLAIGVRAWLGVPLLKDGEMIGAIVIYRGEPRAFSEQQISLLQTFADQAVIAIENVRLFNETKEALERQTATGDILASMSGSMTDTKPVFDAIVRNLQRLFGTRFAVVQLLRDGIVEMSAADGEPGFEKLIERYPRPLDDTTVGGRTMSHKETVQYSPVIDNPQAPAATQQFARDFGFNSVLFTPMIRADNVIGAIGIANRDPRTFDDKQVALIKSFAAQAVIAIENVRLFNETKDALERQTATSDILRSISSSMTDISPVFNTILANAISLCAGDVAVLWQYDGQVLRFAAGNNTTPEAESHFLQHPLELSAHNPTPQAGLERRTVHVLDVFAEPNYRPLVPSGTSSKRPNAPTVLAVPLLRDDDLLGVITIWRYEKRLFTQKQVEMVNTFADQAVIALQNVRLFEEIQEKNRQLEVAGKHKSEFLANMSHELRTPLNAIIGYSEMLQEEAEDLGTDAFIPDLKKINSAGKHLLELINGVLDLSKIESGKMELYLEEFDLATMLDDIAAVIEPLIDKNVNAFDKKWDKSLGTMRADLTKTRQALFNLLSNSAKFTDHGTIGLSVERAKLEGADWLTFTVTDTGIGMTEEQMSRLFQEFSQADASVTRKYGGTGLGLALSRRLARMMGGEITVTSIHGQGSTFVMRLPAMVGESVPEARTGTGGNTILVIDDDAAARDLVQRFLAKEGFSIITAKGGAEGLKMAQDMMPDAITLDVMMPGMDGWAVLSALKAEPATADIPVVMLTIVDDKNLGYALGADDYLTKPIDRERLLAAMKKYRHDLPVLVVDDDEVQRDLLRKILEKDGYAVSEAVNGREALERLGESTPGLILLDLMMPEMDGFEFVEALRHNEAWRSIPVLVITAKELTVDERSRLNVYVEKILQKGASSRDALLREVGDLVAAAIARRKGGR